MADYLPSCLVVYILYQQHAYLAVIEKAIIIPMQTILKREGGGLVECIHDLYTMQQMSTIRSRIILRCHQVSLYTGSPFFVLYHNRSIR